MACNREQSGTLGVALSQIYAGDERNAALIAAVLRDAELNEALRDVSGQRLGPDSSRLGAALLPENGSPRTIALLDLALSFHTWRTLSDARSGSFAVDLMASLLTSNDPAD